MNIKNTASVSSFTAKASNGSNNQKDSVKTAVRKNKADIQLSLAVSIIDDMFQDYCEGKIQSEDIIDKLMVDVGLTEIEASKYFDDIQKQILQDEL